MLRQVTFASFWGAKSKSRKAAGSSNSGAIRATENAASRSLFAARSLKMLPDGTLGPRCWFHNHLSFTLVP